MIDCITHRFGLSIPRGGLHDFIESADNALRTIRETPYHAVVGKSFLHHVDDAADYLERFIRSAPADGPFAAIYCEINGFAINPDQWDFGAFGYLKAGAMECCDWDWLAYWDAEPPRIFVLTGMEKVQEAFANYYLRETKPLYVEIAGELAEHLVTARFMELIAAAHAILRERSPDTANIPILSTAHDWDVIHCSK